MPVERPARNLPAQIDVSFDSIIIQDLPAECGLTNVYASGNAGLFFPVSGLSCIHNRERPYLRRRGLELSSLPEFELEQSRLRFDH